MGRFGGLWGLIILVVVIWAIVDIFKSSASTEKKVLWTVLVILLPLVGVVLWLLLGPRSGRR